MKGNKLFYFTAFLGILLLVFNIAGCKKEGSKAETIKKSASILSTAGKTLVSPAKTTVANSTTVSGNISGIPSDNENIVEPKDEEMPEETDEITVENKYKYDFNGRTIKIGWIVGKNNIGQYTTYPPAPGANMGFEYVYGTDMATDKEWELAREVEDTYNCKLVIRSLAAGAIAARENFMQEVLSGTCDLDIFKTQTVYCIPTFMNKKIIVPLSDYINFDDGDFRFDNPFIKSLVGYNGKYWGIPTSAPQQTYYFAYNMEIRDRNGLEDPIELDLKGQWTWEKFAELCIKSTMDLNGDGTVDQWGVILTRPEVVPGFVSSNKGLVLEYNETGNKFTFAVSDKKAIRALTFISDLFNLYRVAAYDAKAFRNGAAFMETLAKSAAVAGISETTYPSAIGTKLRSVQFPKGPDNDDGKFVQVANSVVGFIPVTAKDPEGVAYLMTKLFRTYTNIYKNPKYPDINALDLNLDKSYFKNDQLQRDYLQNTINNNVDPNIMDWATYGTPFDLVYKFINTDVLNALKNSAIPITPWIESIKYSIQSQIDSLSQ